MACLHTLLGFRFDFFAKYKYFILFFLSLNFLNFFYFFYSRHSIFSFYNNCTFIYALVFLFILRFSYMNWYAFINIKGDRGFFLFFSITTFYVNSAKYSLYKTLYSFRYNFSDNLIFFGISAFTYLFAIF